MEEKQTYIFDGVEVRLTGRTAEKRKKHDQSEDKIDILYELETVNGVSWIGWCRMRDLYEVKNKKEENI